jgi:hypothetical protein
MKTEAVATLLAGIDRSADQGLGTLVAVPLAVGEAIGSVSLPQGVNIALTPGDARPYYTLGALKPGGFSSDEFDPNLHATSEGGWALFVGLRAGDYTVAFERNGSTCSTLIPGYGFGVDDLGHIRVRVREGFATSSIAALCP